MPECTTCGSHLSIDYLRVCGDNEGGIDSCIHCASSEAADGRRSTMNATEPTETGSETDGEKRVLPIEPTDGGDEREETAGDAAQSSDAPEGQPSSASLEESTAARDEPTPTARSGHSRNVLSAVLGALR